MTARDAKNATRELTIITRYQMKKTTEQYAKGTIILVCENDKGQRVTIVLRPNKVHSCNCDGYVKSNGRRRCYHITTCVTHENARAAVLVAQKRAAALVTVEMPAQKKDISTAPLHNNRGFSLLKTA